MTNAYIRLMRLDKPIGILLLLWPTLWALLLANQGKPSFKLLIIFSLGTLFMRTAGCIINDLADIKFDGKVQRTKARPLVSGEISVKKAILLFLLTLGLSALLLLFLEVSILNWALMGAFLAIIYPFCKRFIATPQVMLGVAFSWGIPLAFISSKQALSSTVVVLMLINFLWILSYDTYYALVDKDDDLKIGVKSTAIFLGKHVKLVLAIFQIMSAFLWLIIAVIHQLSAIFYPLYLMANLLFIYQFKLTKSETREDYFKAFINNHWYGMTMFFALLFSM